MAAGPLQDTWARWGYPACMVIAMAAAWWMVSLGIEPLVVFGIVSFASLLFVIPGEWLSTFDGSWKPRWRDHHNPATSRFR